MDMELVSTSGPQTVDYSDVESDLTLAYQKLASLPVNRAVAITFPSAMDARRFARQGRAWAADNGLTFVRKGDVKGEPEKVTFRIYVPRNSETTSADTNAE